MDSAITTVLINGGAFGAVLVLVMLGWLVPKPFYAKLLDENQHLREALALEKQRGNDAEQAGRVTNQLIGALQDLAEEKGRNQRQRQRGDRGLTWEDLA